MFQGIRDWLFTAPADPEADRIKELWVEEGRSLEEPWLALWLDLYERVRKLEKDAERRS